MTVRIHYAPMGQQRWASRAGHRRTAVGMAKAPGYWSRGRGRPTASVSWCLGDWGGPMPRLRGQAPRRPW